MKHPCGVVLLHILVHALDLLVARDEQRVVSDVGGKTMRLFKGFVGRKEESFTAKFLFIYWD